MVVPRCFPEASSDLALAANIMVLVEIILSDTAPMVKVGAGRGK